MNKYQIFAYILIFIGLFLIISSLIGIIRFKNFYSKLHAQAVSDVMGFPVCMIGISLLQNSFAGLFKCLIIVVSYFIFAPVTSHILSKIGLYLNISPYDQIDKKNKE